MKRKLVRRPRKPTTHSMTNRNIMIETELNGSIWICNRKGKRQQRLGLVSAKRLIAYLQRAVEYAEFLGRER